jgi:hypothetical protein
MDVRNKCKILLGNLKEKRPLVRYRRRRVVPNEVGCEAQGGGTGLIWLRIVSSCGRF